MAEATAVAPAGINRREFLYYIWTASMALLLGGGTGATLWFIFPKFREGEFGGKFPVDISELPAINSGPKANDTGKFWLINLNRGFLAVYKVCPHLGCLYKWAEVNNRFECPCHGSKYELDGTYIEGPAPRSLDRFVVTAYDANDQVVGETATGDMNTDPDAGQPISLDGVVRLEVDTSAKILGPLHD